MIGTKTNPEHFTDFEKQTDIEIALNLLRIMDSPYRISGNQGQDIEKNIIREMVKNTLKDITNPYAKKLLTDKMTEYKKQIQ